MVWFLVCVSINECKRSLINGYSNAHIKPDNGEPNLHSESIQIVISFASTNIWCLSAKTLTWSWIIHTYNTNHHVCGKKLSFGQVKIKDSVSLRIFLSLSMKCNNTGFPLDFHFIFLLSFYGNESLTYFI